MRRPARRPTLRPPCAELEALLEQRNQHPERRRELDREIRRCFQAVRAVFILDMAGFSLSVQRRGIIHHLAKIHRMRAVVGQVIQTGGGTVVKFEADNAFATFASVAAALNAAVRINADLQAINRQVSEDDRIAVAIGIGYGTILLGRDDLFGDEVNLASKLGEDIAESGEILLTSRARRALRLRRYRFANVDLSISGIHLRAARLVSGLFPS